MTRLLLATLITVEILISGSHAEEFQQLKGTQALKELKLARATQPYIVTGTYEVPADSELTIEAGTKLAFSKDAALVIRGRLFVKGTESAPISLWDSHRNSHLARTANQWLT